MRDGGAGFGAGVRKPSKEETAGRKGAGRAGATYGDLKVGAGAPGGVAGPGGWVFAEGGEDGGGIGLRRWAGLALALRLEKDCRACEDIGFRLRRAAGGAEKRVREGESAAMVMRCRS
jgi:hypothetical protein